LPNSVAVRSAISKLGSLRSELLEVSVVAVPVAWSSIAHPAEPDGASDFCTRKP